MISNMIELLIYDIKIGNLEKNEKTDDIKTILGNLQILNIVKLVYPIVPNPSLVPKSNQMSSKSKKKRIFLNLTEIHRTGPIRRGDSSRGTTSPHFGNRGRGNRNFLKYLKYKIKYIILKKIMNI